MNSKTQCCLCKNKRFKTTCLAYPEGIPKEILLNRIIHDKTTGDDKDKDSDNDTLLDGEELKIKSDKTEVYEGKFKTKVDAKMSSSPTKRDAYQEFYFRCNWRGLYSRNR